LLGVDGISDFNGLHSRRHHDEVQLYAFDILALAGDDPRKLPLHLRKEQSRAAAGEAAGWDFRQ
jgi:ATP-dependent DNA ligase